jgi:hypothetical protein
MEKEVQIELTSFPPSFALAPKIAAFPSFFAFSWPFEGGPASFISASAYEVLHITIIRRELLKQLVTKLQERKREKRKEKNMYKNNSKTPQRQTKKKEEKKRKTDKTKTLKKYYLQAFRPVSLLPRRQQRSRASSQTSSRSLDPLRVDQPVGWPTPLGERKYRKGSSGPGQERPLDHQIHSPSHHCTNPEPEL